MKYFKMEIVLAVEDFWCDWGSEDEVNWFMSGLKGDKLYEGDTGEVIFFSKDLGDYIPCTVSKVEEIQVE